MKAERDMEFWLDARQFLNGDSDVVVAGFNAFVDAVLVRPDQQDDFDLPARTAMAVEVEETDALGDVRHDAIVVSSDEECLQQASEQGFRMGYVSPADGESTLETTSELLDDNPEYGIFDDETTDQLGDSETTILERTCSAEAAKRSLTNGATTSGGTLLSTHDFEAVYDVDDALRQELRGDLAVESLEITRVEQVGVGERSCVDVISLFDRDEGLIVGSTDAGGLFVCSETHSPPNMSPRPFRVNAGSVHSYVTVNDDETEYLTELSTGDAVLCVDRDGNTRQASIGRKKTETRPLLLVAATTGDQTVEAVLQDHCHVRLMGADGDPINVTEASVGDEILGHVP